MDAAAQAKERAVYPSTTRTDPGSQKQVAGKWPTQRASAVGRRVSHSREHSHSGTAGQQTAWASPGCKALLGLDGFAGARLCPKLANRKRWTCSTFLDNCTSVDQSRQAELGCTLQV